MATEEATQFPKAGNCFCVFHGADYDPLYTVDYITHLEPNENINVFLVLHKLCTTRSHGHSFTYNGFQAMVNRMVDPVDEPTVVRFADALDNLIDEFRPELPVGAILGTLSIAAHNLCHESACRDLSEREIE